MTPNEPDLTALGWSAFFSAQMEHDEIDSTTPVRVLSVHRGELDIVGEGLQLRIQTSLADADDEAGATVGDWLLLDSDDHTVRRRLERKSLFKRRAAGADRRVQLIAANVDTLFIVSSCNADFNVARLERYLALAREAEVTPVIVLTKADGTETPEAFVRDASALMAGLMVEVLDARDADSVASLAPWFGPGQTVALVGSSGVGKSTLVNTLMGSDQIATQEIREDDAKGRHTTTARTLHRLPGNGWVLDTPGMRALQMTDVRSGLDEVFADITDAAATCKFSDCQHVAEPGCAVLAAIDDGTITPDRLKRWRKLIAEDAYNKESIADRRTRERSFGKMIKEVTKGKPR